MISLLRAFPNIETYLKNGQKHAGSTGHVGPCSKYFAWSSTHATKIVLRDRSLKPQKCSWRTRKSTPLKAVNSGLMVSWQPSNTASEARGQSGLQKLHILLIPHRNQRVKRNFYPTDPALEHKDSPRDSDQGFYMCVLPVVFSLTCLRKRTEQAAAGRRPFSWINFDLKATSCIYLQHNMCERNVNLCHKLTYVSQTSAGFPACTSWLDVAANI